MQILKYQENLDESPRIERRRERQAIERTIAMMALGEERGAGSSEANAALVAVQRLWTIFIEDLASPGNALPAQLRADMISIGLWMFREIDDIRSGVSKSFSGLISVSRAIADGLS
jgi:flagellar biosynthesis activator protein FlaF